MGQILFANSRDGWAFGPGLWATHDGGVTWRRVHIGGMPVFSMAAERQRAYAVADRCRSGNQSCAFRVYLSPVGADRWRRIPGAAGTDGGPASVVVSGRTGYVIDTRADLLRSPVLLSGPASGSVPWRPLANPCPGGWSAPLAARGRWLVLGCGSQPGARSQIKAAYLSRDRGLTWRRLTDPPAGGYLEQASITAAGTIFLSAVPGTVTVR